MLEWLKVCVTIIAIIVPSATLVFNIWTNRKARSTRRRNLVNAVYHHATRAVQDLKEFKDNAASIREKIEKDDSYTPYAILSHPDDLTYDQVIEVMELLNEQDDKIILSYFHSESALHAHLQSFDSEFVRAWPRDRKMRLWEGCEKYQKETLASAREALRVLKTHGKSN